MAGPTTTATEEEIASFVLAAHHDLAKVGELYATNPHLLNQRYEKFNETALEAAGHVGRRDIAEFLLERGAPPTVFSASMLGEVNRVRELLTVDPGLAKRRGVHGISLLFHVALSGNVELADLVVAVGTELDPAALHAATSRGHVEMVRWLIAQDVQDVNVKNWQGKTPLKVAEELQHPAIADLLRQAGGSLDAS